MTTDRPFAQTFVGAILVAVVAGIIIFGLQRIWRGSSEPKQSTSPPSARVDGTAPASPGASPAVQPQTTQPNARAGPAAAPVTEQQSVTPEVGASTNEDGSTTWRSGVDGIQIEWATDGAIKRISSRQSIYVESPNANTISTAHTICEEKAKAAIVRFMDQTVSSTRTVTEIEQDLASRSSSSTQDSNAAKVATRTLVSNLKEVTVSYAQGRLRGVMVLGEGFNDTTKEAWTTVGISQDSIRAAQQTQDMTSNPK